MQLEPFAGRKNGVYQGAALAAYGDFYINHSHCRRRGIAAATAECRRPAEKAPQRPE